MLVLDASMALAWMFARPAQGERDCAERGLLALRGVAARVPPIWPAEVANGLLAGERRQLISAEQSADYLRRLDQLAIRVDAAETCVQRDVGRLAREYQLSAYAACYLELALRLGAPLATFDRQLAVAMRAAGGAIFA